MGKTPYSSEIGCFGTIVIIAKESVNVSHSVKEVKIFPFLRPMENIYLIFTLKIKNW